MDKESLGIVAAMKTMLMALGLCLLLGCGAEGLTGSKEKDSLDGIYEWNGKKGQVRRTINFRKNGTVLAQQFLLLVNMDYKGKYTIDGEVVTIEFETLEVDKKVIESKERWVLEMRGDGSLIQRMSNKQGKAIFEYYKK